MSVLLDKVSRQYKSTLGLRIVKNRHGLILRSQRLQSLKFQTRAPRVLRTPALAGGAREDFGVLLAVIRIPRLIMKELAYFL